MAKKPSYKEGDVLLYLGDLLRVDSLPAATHSMAMIEHIENEGVSYFEIKEPNIQLNLGQSSEVLATFYATRRIHSRLNRFKGI